MTRRCDVCGKRRRIWYAGCCESCYIARQREMNRLRNANETPPQHKPSEE